MHRSDVLCKLVDGTFCPVLPTSNSPSCQVKLADLHASALAGHFGAKNMLKLAQAHFYWQNMYKTVKQF